MQTKQTQVNVKILVRLFWLMLTLAPHVYCIKILPCNIQYLLSFCVCQDELVMPLKVKHDLFTWISLSISQDCSLFVTVYSSVKDLPAVTVFRINHSPIRLGVSRISATPCFHIHPPGNLMI